MADIYRKDSAMTLRQEALARVREMQRRAQLTAEPQSPEQHRPVQKEESFENEPQRQVQNAQQPDIFGKLFGQRPNNGRQWTAAPSGIADLLKRQGLGDSIGGLGDALQNTVSSVSQPLSQLLESFGIDGEKLIILLVMWTVFNQEKENKTLLMALGYLLL